MLNVSLILLEESREIKMMEKFKHFYFPNSSPDALKITVKDEIDGAYKSVISSLLVSQMDKSPNNSHNSTTHSI